jgi:hypothetical protein
MYWANCPGVAAGRYGGVTASVGRIDGERARTTNVTQKTIDDKLALYTRSKEVYGISHI